MNDFIEELWSAFSAETGESLTGIGLLLKKAENGLSLEEAATLYREIHSIANLARAMDLQGMAELASGFEVVTGMVRDGKIRIDPWLINLLRESLDVLSRMRLTAISSRKDSEAPVDLTDRLSKALSYLSTNKKTGSSMAPAGAKLHKDPEMLEFFGAILKDNIPGLTGIVSYDYDGGEKQREIVTGALDAIKKASEGMEYDHMTDLLKRLAEQIPAKGPLDDRLEKVALMFVELKQMIDNFERESDVDVGGADFSSALQVFSFNKLENLLDDMTESLTTFKDRGSAENPESRFALGEKVSSLAKSAHGYMRFAYPGPAGYAMIFLEDIYNRIGRDEIAPDIEAIVASKELIALTRRILSEQSQERRNTLEAQSDDLIEKIKDLIIAGESSRFNVEIDDAAQDLLAKVNIKPEMRELILAENMSNLLDALRNGWRLYQITTHLESDERMADAFMQWAQDRARVITSRSLIIGEKSWFEFLVACESRSEVVLNEIKQINPKGDLLQVYEC